MLKSIVRPILFLGIAVAAQYATGQTEPYRNPELSADERARDLLSRLTLDEKISMMTNHSPAIERLGIPEYNWWSEALHGVGRAGTATVFPQAIALAATFDDGAVAEVFWPAVQQYDAYQEIVEEHELGVAVGLDILAGAVGGRGEVLDVAVVDEGREPCGERLLVGGHRR